MQASDLTRLLPDCCSEVLDSMYFTTVLETAVEDTIALSHPGACTFTLRFTGELSGTFGLRVEHTAALSMASNFLGEDEHDLTPEEVEDVIGELANMLCGSIVSRLHSTQKFILSHPEPMPRIPEFDPRELSVLRLDTDYGPITTWVTIQQTQENVCAA